MSVRRILAMLRRDTRGAILVEFAIVGPAFVVLLFGVFQAAVWMQNYNAVRSLASDSARKVLIQYQRDNTLSNTQITALVINTAVSAPYMLNGANLDVDVSNAADQRVAGAREIELAIDYDPPIFLPFVPLDQFTVSYSRPVFVVDPT